MLTFGQNEVSQPVVDFFGFPSSTGMLALIIPGSTF